MTSELTCPNCAREARFREVFGPDDEMHLECTICGAATDDAELALAQPAEVHSPDWCEPQDETEQEVIQ